MNETIIIDCSSRLWFAGVTGGRGDFVVASVEQNGLRNPYLWAEILLDKSCYESPDEKYLARLVGTPEEAGEQSWDFGWHLEGEAHPERVVRLKNPLSVLAEPHVLSGDSGLVRLAAIKLLIFLLRPLVTALTRLGTFPQKRSTLVITPGFLGRAGTSCLLAALRSLGIRRLRPLPRSLAIGLYGIFALGAEDTFCVDSHEEGLTLRHIKGCVKEDFARLKLVHSRTLVGLGWPDILEGLREMGPGFSPQNIRRVLFGIGSFTPPPELIWDRLEALLGDTAGMPFRHHLQRQLVSTAEELGWPGIGLVMSGLCFTVPGAERMVRSILGAGEPFDDSLATERPARGVAAMVGWLSEKSGRRVELSRADGIFLEVGGCIYPVVPSEVLATVNGRGRSFRRQALISVPEGFDQEVLGVHVIQGVGDARHDRVSVGLWTHQVALVGMAFKSELEVTLALKNSGEPARMRGTVRMCLDRREEEIMLHFVSPSVVFTS